MKSPTTVKGYLKMLIHIADDSAHDLKNVTDDEVRFIEYVRGAIQNELGDSEWEDIMKKYKLKWPK